MRIGIDHYTIAHRGLSADEALEFARDHGLDGVQFLDPTSIDLRLDPDRLAAFGRRAGAMGLYVEVGLTSPNPTRQARQAGRDVTPAEHATALARQAEAVAALGGRHARAYVGDRHDRFRTDVRWPDQIDATRRVLSSLKPFLRSLGLKVAIETHADLTASELLGLIDAVGDDTLGVTLDTGNLVMRLDDPVRAVERLAPLVLATHIKDAALAFTDRGLAWQARPVGSGILPMPDLLAPSPPNPELALSIELHPRTYDLPIFDRSWLSHFPGLDPADLAAVVRLAASCESRYSDGSMPRPEAVEAIPWEERDLDWLARSVGYLRPVVDLLRSL